MAGAVAVVLAIVVAALADGGFSAIKHHLAGHQGPLVPGDPPSSVTDQIIYTTRTANDAAIVLPAAVQRTLFQAGQAHQSVELDRIGYTGNVSPSYIDMTPRLI